MITQVAIIWKGKLYSLPAPNRHHHVIHKIFQETNEPIYYSWQGFLDDTGKFLGRKEACKVARLCGQVDVVRPKTSPRHLLFSEDVW